MIVKIDGGDYKVKEGDRVQLSWDGDSNIPQTLHYGWSTVLRVKRTGSLIIQADDEFTNPRTIHKRHVMACVPV